MWIDIKDKSKWPNEDMSVIFGAIQKDGSLDADVGTFDLEDGPRICDCCSSIGYNQTITHWMPIPPLKEKE